MTDLPPAFHHLTIGAGIRSAARRAPDKLAVICEGRSLTYAALVDRMDRIAGAGHEQLGLQVGDRAAILAPNCLEYLEIVAGLADAGVAVATLNPRLGAKEIAHILADCTPKVVFVHPILAATGRQATPPGIEVIVLDDAYEAFLARAPTDFQRPAFPEWQTFAIPYTSGTTGLPKGVLLPHRSRVLTCFGMAAEYGCFGPDDHFYAVAPMAHGAGMAFALGAVYFGGTCTLAPAFDPEAMLAEIASGAITGVFVVPTMLQRILDLPTDPASPGRGHRLKALICNAAALPEPVKLATLDYFGEGVLHECYGATETGIVTNLRPQFQRLKRNCVGTPFASTEIELRGDDGAPVADGEVGELFSRSPYLFNGYHERPDETAATLDAAGWATVGDMAIRDAEGFYAIVDRKKDLVISGGVNIYPREIENVIMTAPGVREAAVIGVPDARWGESLMAYVVADPGASVDEAAIIAACRSELASFKTPRAVRFVDVLPRNAGGKVMKRDLRDAFVRESAAGGLARP